MSAFFLRALITAARAASKSQVAAGIKSGAFSQAKKSIPAAGLYAGTVGAELKRDRPSHEVANMAIGGGVGQLFGRTPVGKLATTATGLGLGYIASRQSKTKQATPAAPTSSVRTKPYVDSSGRNYKNGRAIKRRMD